MAFGLAPRFGVLRTTIMSAGGGGAGLAFFLDGLSDFGAAFRTRFGRAGFGVGAAASGAAAASSSMGARCGGGSRIGIATRSSRGVMTGISSGGTIGGASVWAGSAGSTFETGR